MKVLTFCSYFEPEIAASMYITTNLFEDMAEAGIEVEVFAPTPTRGVDKETVSKYKKIKFEGRYDGKVKIHRFSMMQENNNIFARAVRYILLNLAFIFKGLKTKADIMFIDSTPPTQGFLAAFLKKVKRIPMVYNLQDIFPDSLVHTGISTEKSIFFKIGRFMERVTYKNSDKIIVISEDFKENIMKKGVPEEKIEVVYNWVDENAVKEVEREDNPLFDKFGLDRSKFYVTYCGNIGFTQNMDMLLEAAERLADYNDIKFVIVGDGGYRQELEKNIADKNIKNIKIIPFQPYEEISNVFSLGNVGVIISKSGVGSNSVPSKTWSYMSAKRPVIASFDEGSELHKIVKESECGVCAKADDLDEFVNAVLYIYKNPAEAILMGQKGRATINERFSRKKATARYIDVLRKVGEK